MLIVRSVLSDKLQGGLILLLRFKSILKDNENPLMIMAIALVTILFYTYGILPLKETTVKANNINFFETSFSEDWLTISEITKIPEDAKLEDFKAIFKSDGQLSNLEYRVIGENNNKHTYYLISLYPDENLYKIKIKTRIPKPDYYDELLNVSKLVEVLDQINFLSYKPRDKEYPLYVVTSFGRHVSYGGSHSSKYMLIDDGVKELNYDDLPIAGRFISFFGWQMNSPQPTKTIDFLFDVRY